MENTSLQTSILQTRKTSNSKQSKKGFKIQISSSELFTLSVYIRKSNSRIKVSLKHNQLFREDFNTTCSVQPKVIQLIPQ